MYQCAAFSEELLSAFHIATTKDCYQIHPPIFCNKCYLKHVTTAAIHKKPYKCGLKPYDWYNHTIHSCNCTKGNPAVLVCLLLKHDGVDTPAQVVQHIIAIAPSETIQNSIVPPLANTQLLSAISELNCPICLSVLRRPIQLPCERLVCACCLTEWIHLRGSFCPCCLPKYSTKYVCRCSTC